MFLALCQLIHLTVRRTEYLPLPPPAIVNNYITPTSSTAFITVHAPFHIRTHFLYPTHMIGQTSAVWLTITSQSMKWSVKLTDAITCREQPLQIGCFLFQFACSTCRCFHCRECVAAAGLNLDNAPG